MCTLGFVRMSNYYYLSDWKGHVPHCDFRRDLIKMFRQNVYRIVHTLLAAFPPHESCFIWTKIWTHDFDATCLPACIVHRGCGDELHEPIRNCTRWLLPSNWKSIKFCFMAKLPICWRLKNRFFIFLFGAGSQLFSNFSTIIRRTISDCAKSCSQSAGDGSELAARRRRQRLEVHQPKDSTRLECSYRNRESLHVVNRSFFFDSFRKDQPLARSNAVENSGGGEWYLTTTRWMRAMRDVGAKQREVRSNARVSLNFKDSAK